MNFDNLVHDLRILISTWNNHSNYKKCLEIFLQDKEKSHHRKKYVDTERANIKNATLDDNHANLKIQTMSLIKKGYRPVLPSTYIIGKRKPRFAPKQIMGWPNANDKNNDLTEPFVIDSTP